jgi:hypothetical protein
MIPGQDQGSAAQLFLIPSHGHGGERNSKTEARTFHLHALSSMKCLLLQSIEPFLGARGGLLRLGSRGRRCLTEDAGHEGTGVSPERPLPGAFWRLQSED